MITLRLDPAAGVPRLDRPAASVNALILIRHASRFYAEVDASRVGQLTRALAYAGIAAVPCGPVAVPSRPKPPERIFAIGRRLDPLPIDAYAFDVCRVRAVDLGTATRDVLRRWLPWLRRPSPTARELCRRLLRGDDGMFAWERRVWLPASSLRDRRVRMVVRPVVFGSSDPELQGRSLVSAGELERWAS